MSDYTQWSIQFKKQKDATHENIKKFEKYFNSRITKRAARNDGLHFHKTTAEFDWTNGIGLGVLEEQSGYAWLLIDASRSVLKDIEIEIIAESREYRDVWNYTLKNGLVRRDYEGERRYRIPTTDTTIDDNKNTKYIVIGERCNWTERKKKENKEIIAKAQQTRDNKITAKLQKFFAPFLSLSKEKQDDLCILIENFIKDNA